MQRSATVHQCGVDTVSTQVRHLRYSVRRCRLQICVPNPTPMLPVVFHFFLPPVRRYAKGHHLELQHEIADRV